MQKQTTKISTFRRSSQHTRIVLPFKIGAKHSNLVSNASPKAVLSALHHPQAHRQTTCFCCFFCDLLRCFCLFPPGFNFSLIYFFEEKFAAHDFQCFFFRPQSAVLFFIPPSFSFIFFTKPRIFCAKFNLI